MKKILFFCGFLFAAMTAQAQSISPNAIGIRIGGGTGTGAELSYQRALGANNRLELDLGFSSSRDRSVWNLSGIYQWVWQLENNFNWYVGAGGTVGSWSWRDDIFDRGDSGFFLAVAGQVGIEYNFNIPLLISLDFMPQIGLVNPYVDLIPGIGLGIRYQF